MNYQDWYTDTLEIWRISSQVVGNLTKSKRYLIGQNIPCRIYQNDKARFAARETAAETSGVDMLSCDNAVDIVAGDELLIVRGGQLNSGKKPDRYFAGKPKYYYEPFGAVIPGLAHQEVALSAQERNKR